MTTVHCEVCGRFVKPRMQGGGARLRYCQAEACKKEGKSRHHKEWSLLNASRIQEARRNRSIQEQAQAAAFRIASPGPKPPPETPSPQEAARRRKAWKIRQARLKADEVALADHRERMRLWAAQNRLDHQKHQAILENQRALRARIKSDPCLYAEYRQRARDYVNQRRRENPEIRAKHAADERERKARKLSQQLEPMENASNVHRETN